jgi:GntR family transcriptional regulator
MAGLTRSSPEPLYRQLAQQLESAIAGGKLGPGDRLDSEGQLSERFGVSRITVRQAIEELARKQLVVRKQGKGTFVTKPAVKHDLRRLHGLLASLFAQSDAASTELLRYELATPPPNIAQLLGLKRAQSALALDRLYLIGGRPVALAQAWLAPEVAVMPRAQADLISTEDMMRAAGIRIATSQVSIRAEAAGTTVGRLLALPARAPVLVLRRNALAADGVAKEVSRVWFCSDAYELVCTETSANVFIIRSAQGEHTGEFFAQPRWPSSFWPPRQPVRHTHRARRSPCASPCSRRRW